MKPIRLQLSRARGYNLQSASMAANGLPAVKVDRSTRWGNPFIVGKHGTRDECVDLYAKLMAGYLCLTTGNGDEQVATHAHVVKNRHKLRGKHLACWCPLIDKDGNRTPCHADVLLQLANEQTSELRRDDREDVQ